MRGWGDGVHTQQEISLATSYVGLVQLYRVMCEIILTVFEIPLKEIISQPD